MVGEAGLSVASKVKASGFIQARDVLLFYFHPENLKCWFLPIVVGYFSLELLLFLHNVAFYLLDLKPHCF